MQWQGAVDNSNGVGVGYYQVHRTDGLVFNTWDASFEDTSVQAGTTYTYQISAIDMHNNSGPATNLVVTTPQANLSTRYSPAHRGIRPTDTYWGGAGEQINIFGGNLNYTVPLITALGRGGPKATFSLSYNSQNWVVGSGTSSFVEGVDTGYGFGWQLMLGSLMPVYAPSGMEYWYTDATGGQYRMVLQSGSVWTGNASFYAWYDSNTNRLYFRDGSFWVMGCVAAGGEPDAGTMYPTAIQDSNGNQLS